MATTTTSKSPSGLIVFAIIVLLAIVAYFVLTMPDKRSTTDKIGDAVHELPNGVDKAGRQLENRTPGEKLGDAVKDSGDSIKNSTESR